jgi:hypothetical protein
MQHPQLVANRTRLGEEDTDKDKAEPRKHTRGIQTIQNKLHTSFACPCTTHPRPRTASKQTFSRDSPSWRHVAYRNDDTEHEPCLQQYYTYTTLDTAGLPSLYELLPMMTDRKAVSRLPIGMDMAGSKCTIHTRFLYSNTEGECVLRQSPGRAALQMVSLPAILTRPPHASLPSNRT